MTSSATPCLLTGLLLAWSLPAPRQASGVFSALARGSAGLQTVLLLLKASRLASLGSREAAIQPEQAAEAVP
jgi:hypothetical protein